MQKKKNPIHPHNNMKQHVFVHVDPKNITMGYHS